MDEQRIQAYTALINQLLCCAQGEEDGLLQANVELVDAEFLAAMRISADWLEIEGKGNAGWLRQFAAQLEQSLLLEQGEASSQSQDAALAFSWEIMQLITRAECDRTQVYAFFKANMERLDEALLRVLPDLFAMLAKQVGPSLGAQVFVLFGTFIQLFPFGNRRLNMEQAITAYRLALTVITQLAMPVEWAETMHTLAVAYSERIDGDRSENIEQAIIAYQAALTVITQSAMPVEWAETMHGLAIAYSSERIDGDRAENIEQAIAAYQAALTVRTQSAMPIEWAETMNNLANAYEKRIDGDRAENIEQAIAAHQAALTVMTQSATPVEWATTMNNLANAYEKRIRGDRAENIEQAITAFQAALTVRTQSAMPVEWAETMNNLANAYSERIDGDRAENIEQAITAFRAMLTIRTQSAMSVEWATTMYNLANVYAERIGGDRAENIEQAITAYQEALTVRTQLAMPVEWAETMHNLAIAYWRRIRGDRAENIEQAITICQAALTVMTQSAMPDNWASAMMNLANAYAERIGGDRAENIEQAITAYQEALTVRTQLAMPVEWALTTHNLATAYSNRIGGDRAENIEQAIEAYQAVLTVRTLSATPIAWAQTMNNLADAYSNRIDGDRAENIEQAIEACQAGLEVFVSKRLPNDCRKTAYGLARLYSDQQRWQEAVRVYQKALQAAETLYQGAILLDSKATELAATADLHRQAAYALARTDKLQAAILVLEQGRARGLSESLERDRANLTHLERTTPQLYQQYQTLTTQLRNLESQQRDLATSDHRHHLTATELRDTATALQDKLTQTITEIRHVEGYSDFLAQTDFEDIRTALHRDDPLIYLVTTTNGSMALIVSVDATDVLWLDALTEKILGEILYGPAEDSKLSRYLGTYQDFCNDSKANYPAWFKEIDITTRQLWDSLMGPLIQKVKDLGFKRLTLIPTGYLSVLPLHAAWTEDNLKPKGRRYAFDDLHITYTPNALSLKAASTVAASTPITNILAINEPQPVSAIALRSSSHEIAKAISTFSAASRTLIQHEDATRTTMLENLPRHSIVHFSCHGSADFTTPLNSGLSMANNEILSLRDFLDLQLKRLRLVVLSACETGIPGTALPDEVVSLPTGLLQAGVAGVVSSLWSVADLSTMVLLSRFYELWRTEKLHPPAALRQAQIWLRDSTGPQLAPYLKKSNPALAQKFEQALDEHPFAHPFYWAAFTYTGV